MNLTDPQAYALIRAILAGKFQTSDSTALLGLPALHEVLVQLLARDWTDPRLSRIVANYESEATHPESFPPVQKLLQLEIDGGLLPPEAKAITDRLATLLYPNWPTPALAKYYIDQLV